MNIDHFILIKKKKVITPRDVLNIRIKKEMTDMNWGGVENLDICKTVLKFWYITKIMRIRAPPSTTLDL